MKNIAVIDIETDPFRYGRYPQPFAAGFRSGSVSVCFWGTDCIHKLVEKCHSHEGIIYAHNGGKFDYHFLIGELYKKFGKKMEVMIIANRIVKIKTPINEYRDSWAIVPKKLASWGKDEIDYDCFEADRREKYKVPILTYLKGDLDNLYDLTTEFWKRYGDNLTLATTAFHVMKKEFGMEHPRTGYDYDERFRKWYFSGRVQFFGLGEFIGDYRVVDINSAFPWAMKDEHWYSPDYVKLTRWPTRYKQQSFYHVTCDSNGALPSRAHDKSVHFPIVENQEFFVCGWELLKGMELGLVSNVKLHAVYSPVGCRNFGDYVDHFYDLKKNATNSEDRYFAKIFLNSGYGKYALNPREFEDVKITEYKDKIGPIIKDGWEHKKDVEAEGLTFWAKKTFPTVESLSFKTVSGKQIPISKFYNVCTAASITSKVRAFLMESIHNSDGVLYCDTDSLIAKKTDNLSIGPELGQWKLEQECDRVYIAGKKLYAAHNKHGPYSDENKEWKIASKGVRVSPDQIIEIATEKSEYVEYQFDAPSYSVKGDSKFTRRKVRRDDKRKKRKQ